MASLNEGQSKEVGMTEVLTFTPPLPEAPVASWYMERCDCGRWYHPAHKLQTMCPRCAEAIRVAMEEAHSDHSDECSLWADVNPFAYFDEPEPEPSFEDGTGWAGGSLYNI